MKALHPVLRPVHKANKKAKACGFALSGEPACEQPSAQPVSDATLADIRKSLEVLPTCSSQAVNTAMRAHLDTPSEANRALLDGWERCGRRDYQRAEPVKFRTIVKEVCSPLGLACLWRYARGYLDEAEATVKATQRRD